MELRSSEQISRVDDFGRGPRAGNVLKELSRREYSLARVSERNSERSKFPLRHSRPLVLLSSDPPSRAALPPPSTLTKSSMSIHMTNEPNSEFAKNLARNGDSSVLDEAMSRPPTKEAGLGLVDSLQVEG